MAEPVLTLDTLEPVRSFITIDKKRYELRDADELTLTQTAHIHRLAQEISNAGKPEAQVTEEEAKRFEDFANEMLAIVVIGLPDEMRDKLTIRKKYQIVSAFNALASQKWSTEVGEGSSKTSDGSSQGSADSTGVPSASG